MRMATFPNTEGTTSPDGVPRDDSVTLVISIKHTSDSESSSGMTCADGMPSDDASFKHARSVGSSGMTSVDGSLDDTITDVVDVETCVTSSERI